jgi:hypothetical protein
MVELNKAPSFWELIGRKTSEVFQKAKFHGADEAWKLC